MTNAARKSDHPSAGDGSLGASRGVLGFAAAVAGLIVIGLIVGLPTLDGDFLAGDDVMLLRDHALINHPSLSNAWELLRIVHRDLYQPLPMLSFQLDYIWFGRSLAEGNAWGIHLVNVVYHILNGLLAWGLILQLTGKRTVSFLVGAAFLAHPLAIESVAWLSGRMMLLSGFFLLLTLIFFDKWQVEGRRRWLVFAVLACLACMLCKVRVELPFLLLAMRYYRRMGWWSSVWWGGFALVSVISTGFSLYAVETTEQAGVWEDAAEKFQGPPMARALRTLGWYLSHYFWPTGLSGWYYPPVEITWTQPVVLGSILLIAVCFAGTVWWWRLGHRSAVGMLFFLVGIGPMLQYFPSRFTLACDRYMYLPMIGLHWMFGTVVLLFVQKMRQRVSSNWPAHLAGVAGMIVLGMWIRGSIVHGADYKDDVALRKRDTELYPHMSGAWARLGWANIRQGRYREGLEAAMHGLEIPNRKDALAEQAVGFAYYKLGEYEKAVEYLKRAYQREPDSPKPAFRLGRVYEALGRNEEAIALYKESIRKLNFYEHALMALANLYVRLGRTAEAAELYRTVLKNNRHQYMAAYELGTIELQQGRIPQAMERFVQLIEWMPEHLDARTQLGICLARSGMYDRAAEVYDGVLRDAPGHALARLNRASLELQRGDLAGAERDYAYLLRGGRYPPAAVNGLSQVYVRGARFEEAATLWQNAWETSDKTDESMPEKVLWYAMIAGKLPIPDAARRAKALHEKNPDHPIPMLTLGWIAFEQDRRDEAVVWFVRAGKSKSSGAREAISSAMLALEHRSRSHPDDPGPYYLGAVLMKASGNIAAARAGFEAFLTFCKEETWKKKASDQLATLTKTQPTTGTTSHPATTATSPAR